MNKLIRTEPGLTEIGIPEMPEVTKLMLDNDIPVYLIESGTEDLIRIDFTFRAGQIKENTPVLASATNLMLKEGSEKYTAVELNRLIDYYGSFTNLYTEKDIAGLTVYLLNKHLERIFELIRQMLFFPVFPEEELSMLMKKQLRWYQIRRQKVQNLAMDGFFESVFGKSHPYGRKPIEANFENMTRTMVKDFHLKYYTPGNLTIFVAGRIPANIEVLLNKFFGEVPETKTDPGETTQKIKGTRNKKVHIQLDGVSQNCIKIGSATISKKNGDYQDLKIADTILGGYFGSRLMKNIREDKGYTYGISSYVTSLEDSGYKVISTDVSIENTNAAIDEIFKEIRLLQTVPVDVSELAISKNYMLGELIRMFDGPFASADTFKSAWEFGFDNDYYRVFFERIRNITPEEIMDTALKYFKINDLYTVTAGTI